MTKAQHTPGPWFAEYGAAHNVIFSDQGIACIATIHHGVDPSSDANARLIASAPELLAALERLVNVTPIDCDYHGLPIDKQLDAALTLAESAIAKAKGIEQ